MQTELAGLSSDHAHVLALRSDHFIYRDQPLVVIAAVRAVVRAVRDEAPLPPCERLFTGSGRPLSQLAPPLGASPTNDAESTEWTRTSSRAIATRQTEQPTSAPVQANATARRPTIMLASLTWVTRCGLLRLME